MIQKLLLSAAASFFLLTTFSNLLAQDRLFTYTYQSNVLEKGQKEIEIWNTYRTGKEKMFNRLDSRAEFEVGLGKNLQTSFYLNITTKSFEEDNSGIISLQSENEFSFSNEWKYKISDPVANPLGFALYGEYSVAPKEYELEGKIILDKKIKDFTLAVNLTGELEYESETDDNAVVWNTTKKIDAGFGLAYPLSNNFHLSFEAVNKNVISKDVLEGSALFAGLGFSYFTEGFWVNFTVLPQITSFKGAENNKLNLKNFEKLETRLIFSYVL